MRFETIEIKRNRHIAIIHLNRPKVKNALNREMVEELLSALSELEQESEIRAIVLAGEGSSFCTGRDLTDARKMKNEDLVRRRFAYRRMAKLMTEISKITKPIIAAVQGYALGGGCGLAVSCDIVIASEDAVFGVPEVKIGLVPGTVTAPLFRSVGRKKATEMILTGETLDAHEGCAVGLINKVVAKEKLVESALELAEKIANCSPIAIKIWKQAVSAQYDSDYTRLTDNFAEIVTLSSSTADASEGLAAFLEKRKPEWQNR
jgi:enoyl-CoA hydratase/carnithine racemase